MWWTRPVFHRLAQRLFRRYSNDLGLYAEEIDERTGAGRTDAAQAGLGAILGALYQFSGVDLSGLWRHRFFTVSSVLGSFEAER
jgi:hypothetical protein